MRTVMERKEKDWYERLCDQDNRFVIHEAKRAFAEAKIAKYKRVSRKIEKEMELRATAERHAREDQQSNLESRLLEDLLRTSALMIRSGTNPTDVAQKFGQAIDM